jgi:hypothetical protein
MKMLKLYRGIIDILICKSETLTSAFSEHIRAFNEGSDDQNYGTTGFWNLLLEVTYQLYVKTFVGIGLLMTITLAVCFFPLYAMTRAFGGSFQMIRQYEQPPQTFIEPKVDVNQEKK